MSRLGHYTTSAAVIATAIGLSSCAEPDGVIIELAPEVISSQDGTLHARATVLNAEMPQKGETVTFSVSYFDRNGTEHSVADAEAKSDERGTAEVVFQGLNWEGAGEITATLNSDESLTGIATFSVLDLTPPTVEILPPTEDLRVGPGFPLEVYVSVTDEIGVSEVFLEATGELDRLRSTVVASGSDDTTVRFELDIPDNARSGPTITLYALAADLSGNLTAAEPVVLTVDPTIAFALTEGLRGQVTSEGSQDFLDAPRALALSPKNSMLYVADNSDTSPCNGACVRRVDPATGLPAAGVVFNGNGTIEGVAFDSAGDTLFVSDRQDRIHALSYNAIDDVYEAAQACNNFGSGDPQDPMHLIHDATLGLLVADRNDQRVKQKATCDGNDPADFSSSSFDSPWGIAAGAAGEFYVSDEGNDRVYLMADDGGLDLFEDRALDEPRGLAWLASGSSFYADSLMVANYNRRTILSTIGIDSARTAVYLRNRPVDIEIAGSVMYVLTEPSAGDAGRILTFTDL